MKVGCGRLSLHRVVSAFLFALLAAWTCPARAQILGPEFRVNSYTTSFQYGPATAADAAGNFIVVWTSYGKDGSYGGVFGQRFDANGLPQGVEFQVNSYTTGSQYGPAVAADASGGFVVAWNSQYQDGSYGGVFGQRFGPAGLPVGPEFQVNTYTTSAQGGPAVAIAAAGEFVVVWSSYDQDGSYDGVFGQRFDAQGVPSGSEFRVNTYTTSTQALPTVAVDGSGGFVVAWWSHDQDGSSGGIFAQRFDAAGLPVDGEFQVNTYTAGLQVEPALAVEGPGNFVVVWSSHGQDGSYSGVFGQRFDPAGLPVGGEFQVNTYTTFDQSHPAVAANAAGDFVVAWVSLGQGLSGLQFGAAGFPVGSEFRINSDTAAYPFSPALSAGAAGDFVVAWEYYGLGASYSDVFGRQWRTPYFADGFEAGDACAWSAAVGGGCP